MSILLRFLSRFLSRIRQLLKRKEPTVVQKEHTPSPYERQQFPAAKTPQEHRKMRTATFLKKEAKEKKVEKRAIGDASRVLLKPRITEKATLTETYVFEVQPSATKSQVKRAVKDCYGVAPRKVNIITMRGKAVRWNFRSGEQSQVKKAMVRLSKGERLDIYEGT